MSGGRWRYQPVIAADEDGSLITLCEIHIDAHDRLTAWSDPSVEPQGETAEELGRDLARMLVAVWKWVPVPYLGLRAGMAFERTGVDVEDMLGAMERARSMASSIKAGGA